MALTEYGFLVNTILLLALWIFFFTQSRRWTGIGQDTRLRAIEDEMDIIRKNVSRLDRDHNEVVRGTANDLQLIWKELRAMHAEETPCVRRIMAIEDAIMRVDQTIATMPCVLDGRVHDGSTRAVEKRVVCPRCGEGYSIGSSHVCGSGA